MIKVKNSHRLGSSISPERYAISLRIDFEAFVFEGEETITLNILKPTREITLHSKDLEIEKVSYCHYEESRALQSLRIPSKLLRRSPDTAAGSLPRNDRGVVSTFKIQYNSKNETVTFRFAKALPKGKGVLKLLFRGRMNERMEGLYKSQYTHKGQTKHLALTQFEATDARRCFPCFDEPKHKAIFEIRLIVPEHHTTVSNTYPIDIAENESGYKIVRFAPTPPMSTYLLAFISGEFEWVEGYAKKKKRKTLVRVLTTPGKKVQGKFALSTAIKILEFFEEYFDIDYPLPILDLIAVPDFAAGAMENWGAIIFRESALLIDDTHSSARNRQWVAEVIAHEIAHQWFGNLVTMEWWTHLWLNEGFASYIGTLAVSKVFPKWQMWEQFMTSDFVRGLEKDALASSHRIEVDVNHPSEIGQIFDDISYRKGASIIRMLAEFLGGAVFREGLRRYLNKHSYNNAVTEDLWLAFEHMSGRPIKKMMRTWTNQAGFPLVSVIKTFKGIQISQQRFSTISLRKPADKFHHWIVPVSFLSSPPSDMFGTRLKTINGNRQALIVLSRNTQTLPVDSILKLNHNTTGFYRVNYELPHWQHLTELVSKNKFSVPDRLGILSDAFALARAGYLTTSVVLQLAIAYKGETELAVIQELVKWLRQGYTLVGVDIHFKKYSLLYNLIICRRTFFA